MMILSQDGMVAVNSDNVVMFEAKETETLPHETQLCATILVYNGGHFRRVIGTYHGLDRAEVAKTALDYISFSVGSAHTPESTGSHGSKNARNLRAEETCRKSIRGRQHG